MIPYSRKYSWTFRAYDVLTPSVSSPVTVNTTQVNPVNRYSYSARNLWLAYGLANFFALLSVILGIVAFKHNDASHNNSLSNVMSVSQDPELGLLFPRCCRGVFPLPEETMRAKLKVVPDALGGQSLKPESGQQQVKCEACDRESKRSRSSQSTQRTQRPSVVSTIFGRVRTRTS